MNNQLYGLDKDIKKKAGILSEQLPDYDECTSENSA